MRAPRHTMLAPVGFPNDSGQSYHGPVALNAGAPRSRLRTHRAEVLMRRLILTGWLVAAAFACAAGETPVPSGRVSDGSVVRDLMKQFIVPGVGIAVIKDFTIVATYAYGVADVETGAPV